MNKSKKLFNTFLEILLYLVGSMPFISCTVACYWLYHIDAKYKALRKHRILTYCIYISGLITLFVVLFAGVRKFLFFIPWSWGSHDYETGEWQSTREFISVGISMFASGYILKLFEDYERLQIKLAGIKYKEKQPGDREEEDL